MAESCCLSVGAIFPRIGLFFTFLPVTNLVLFLLTPVPRSMHLHSPAQIVHSCPQKENLDFRNHRHDICFPYSVYSWNEGMLL